MQPNACRDREPARRAIGVAVTLSTVIAAATVVSRIVAASAAPAPAPATASATALPAAPSAPGAPLGAPLSVYQPVGPIRLADTRQAACGCSRHDDGSTITVEISGRDGIPARAIAAALTITITDAAAGGYATVWPSGTPRRTTSAVNWEAGQTVANSTIVPIGADGAVDVDVSANAGVIVDISGVFVPTAGDATAGRFIALPPERLVDTRGGVAPAAPMIRVALPPTVADDATAVVATVTATDASRPGYLSARPAGSPHGGNAQTSILNIDAAGQTRAATIVAPVSPAGFVVEASMATHVIVDIVGWFTGPSAPRTDEGAFVALAPTRLVDTRHGGPLLAGGTRELAITDLPSPAAAVVTNLTVTQTAAPGFLTAHAARTPRPATSTANWSTGATVANLAITQLSTAGVGYSSSAQTDLAVDLTGYFVGRPLPATEPVPVESAAPWRDAAGVDLLEGSLPADVAAALANVEVYVVDDLGGYDGYATAPIALGPGAAPGFTLTGAIRFSRSLLAKPLGARQTIAAHEAGHILEYFWISIGNIAGDRPADRVDAIGGDECAADAVGRELFRRNARNGYDNALYDGALVACSTTPEARALAIEIVENALARA